MALVARNLASRTIHIKIYPTAHSFPERREVLRVLERFGEVEMFRSLKYDPTNPVPDAFLSILTTEEATQAAIEASPIRYRLITGPDPSPPPPTVENTTLDSAPPSGPAATHPQHQPHPKNSDTIFELRITPSSYPHHETIAYSPLHSHYTPISPIRSHIAADLASQIPDSIAKPGLIDWVTDSPRINTPAAAGRARTIKKRDGDGEGNEDAGVMRDVEKESKIQWGRVVSEAGKPWRLREKERVEREKDVPAVMKGLLTGVETKLGGSSNGTIYSFREGNKSRDVTTEPKQNGAL